MFINLWTTSPFLAGVSRGWEIWFTAMARSQDLSAPWRNGTTDHARAWRRQRRDIGPYESLSASM